MQRARLPRDLTGDTAGWYVSTHLLRSRPGWAGRPVDSLKLVEDYRSMYRIMRRRQCCFQRLELRVVTASDAGWKAGGEWAHAIILSAIVERR